MLQLNMAICPKDYIFDLERFASFEGNTGPYILYTMVRIKSILAKYHAGNTGKKPVAINAVIREYGADEIALMLLAARFNDVIEHAYEETAPHKIWQMRSVVFIITTKLLQSRTKSSRENGFP